MRFNGPVLKSTYLAWPLTCLAICLFGLAPFQNDGGAGLLTAASLCALLALLLALMDWKQRREPPLLIGLLLLHGLVLAGIWLVAPLGDANGIMAVVVLLLLGATIWLARRAAPMPPATIDLDTRHAPLDLAILVLPVLMAANLDGGEQARALASTYPATLLKFLVITVMQFYLFLDLPVRVLRQRGVAAGPASLACASVFVLLHLPNPLLMTTAGLLMWLFSWQYQQGRSMPVLVLLMALTATTITIALPESITGDLRIGPDYMDHMLNH